MQLKFGETLVKDGMALAAKDVRDRPVVQFKCGVEVDGAFFTVTLTDPDAPSPADPKYGPWVHYVVINVAGKEVLDLDSGESLVDWVPSAPGEGSGVHGYVLHVFRQTKGRVEPPAMEKIPVASGFAPRRNFDLDNLVKTLNLEPVKGTPVVYKTEYDDSVPEIHKKVLGE